MGNNQGTFPATNGGVTFTAYGATGTRGWNGSGGGGSYSSTKFGAAVCVTTGGLSAAQAVQPASCRIGFVIKY